jgi:hypothetical protein
MYPHVFARAYINFKNQEDIVLFRDRFDGYVFIDNRGVIHFSSLKDWRLRPPEWRGVLRYCIAVPAVPLEILVTVQALSQPATTGRPMGPSIVWVRGGGGSCPIVH